MSIKVMTRVWDESDHKGSELLLLLALADNAREEDSRAWPGLTTLTKKTRLSSKTVRRKLATLVESGELYIHAVPGKVHYYVVLTGMDEAAQQASISALEEYRGGPSKYAPPADPVTRVPGYPGNTHPGTRVTDTVLPGYHRSVTNGHEPLDDAAYAAVKHIDELQY